MDIRASFIEEPGTFDSAEANQGLYAAFRAKAGLKRWVILFFWIGAILALLLLSRSPATGWDAHVCHTALRAVEHGGDPYAANMAAIQDFRDRLSSGNSPRPPILYVYSLFTLPILRLLAAFPDPILGLFYRSLLVIGLGLQLWAGFQMARLSERRWLSLLLPMVVFFPGLITDDVVLSGNVAFLLYGIMLATAIPGWKNGNWRWYYLAVFFASIFKLPYLCMVAFPVLLDRRQWLRSCLTCGVGVGAFVAQFWLWPGMSREYIESIRFMFDVGHDFGYSFAGEANLLLWRTGVRTWSADVLIYIAFAAPFGLLLLYLGRRAQQGEMSRESFIPLALLGTAMLNPRIMNYDLVPITIPMVLLTARTIVNARRARTVEPLDLNEGFPAPEASALNKTALAGALGLFLVANMITIAGPQWIPVELTMLCVAFASGAWQLLHTKMAEALEPEPVETEVATY